MWALPLLALQSGGSWKIRLAPKYLIGNWYVLISQEKTNSFSFSQRLIYIGGAMLGASVWWYISYENDSQFIYEHLVK